MPDISMCTDKNCPKKKTCYRFNAIPNELSQSYSAFKYNKGCGYYRKSEIKIIDNKIKTFGCVKK